MKKIMFPALLLAGGVLTATVVQADNATMHGKNLRHDGNAIRMTKFDVTLDGRLLTAEQGVYHPDTGIVELKGNVRLAFGPKAKTFPSEVK